VTLRSPNTWILTLAVLFPLSAAAANLGIIHGTVRDDGGHAVVGAKASLAGDDERPVDEHTTDSEGHFDFEQVPFGDYHLSFSAPGRRSVEHLIHLSSGDVVSVDETLPLALTEELVVRATVKAPPPAQTASSTSTLSHRMIKELPRGDTASVNEILSTQPGFVYDAMGNLFARGNHANIQFELDGVALPDAVSGLFGGFLSPKLIDSMEVITGGLAAEYGDRLAAVVNLNARRPSEAGEGEAEVLYGAFQTVSPSAFYGRKFGRWSFLVGGSMRWTERALDPPAPAPILHDSGEEQRLFLRAEYQASDKDQISVLASFSHNFYEIPLDPTAQPYNPALPNGGRAPDAYGNPAAPYFPPDTQANENERDFFGLVSYRHDFGPKASVRLSTYVRESYGLYFGDAVHALGPTADPSSNASDVQRQARHFGVDGEYLLRLGESHVVKVGGKVDQLYGLTHYTSYTRSDALQAVDPTQTLSGEDQGQATQGGFFVEDRASWGPWVVNGGVRLDFQKVSFAASPDQALETGAGPRLGVSYGISPNIVAHAFAGLMWMPPPVLDTPAAARQLGVVAPNAPVTYDLLPEQDRYAELGVAARVLPELTLTLNAWGKLSVDQLDDIQVGNTNLVTPYNFAKGRAGGVEAGAVAVLSRRVHAFANLSLERAQGQGIATATYLFPPSALANPGWQLLDHVQTWTANLGATFHDGPPQLSALAAYGSGLRTGPANNEHVPGWIRVDATLAQRLDDVALKPTVAFDVVNLFDAQYAYRIGNGFNGSHWAPGRSLYLRLSVPL